MRSIRFSVLFVLLATLPQLLAQSPQSLRLVNADSLNIWKSLHPLQPQQAVGFFLDVQELRALLDKGQAIALPNPEGRSTHMVLERHDVMAPELAKKYPGIGAWKGRAGKASVRLDLGSQGLHVQVLGPDGSWYIDPVTQGDSQRYLCYTKASSSNPHEFYCFTEEEAAAWEEDSMNESLNPNGTTLRTYRLALACTGEYANYHGGTTTSVLSAMNTAMNRVNGIYARELAVEMILIPNNDQLIFFDAGNDPYSNNDGFSMLGENQSTVDQIIGSNNYDLGHVFSTGGGGIANLASVCTNDKAEGVTGLGNPIGDPFYVDYVAHEMGHQFNGSHTFNSSLGGCNGNRSGNNAYEPGSGSTIMAYAGLCSSDNIANNSDDYFHVRNYQTMLNFLQGTGGSCAASSATNNTPPVVVAASTTSTTFPIETPFKLEAAGSDSDGDPISYCWEHYNRGPSVPINQSPSSGTPPLFVSLPPVTEHIRWFPRLNFVVNNVNSNLEKLPTYSRNMTFRVTVRDNLGGVSYDQVAYNSTDQAGPFKVNNPNTVLAVWNAGTTVTVDWDVANTQNSPVNCSDVRIRLSTDGGFTYPHTLLSSTPNDGSESFVLNPLPGEPALISQARVMVESIGNIFYDISNADFTINNILSTATWSSSASAVAYPNPSKDGVFQLPQSGAFTDWTWQVLDVAGREVPFRLSPYMQLRIEGAPSGIYFLIGQHGNSSHRERLLIP